MPVPYPPRGSTPWDDSLKDYIDAPDSPAVQAAKQQVADDIPNSATPIGGALSAAYAPMASVAGLDPWIHDPTRGRNFKIHYADALSNPCDMLFIGDSVTEGYGATSINTRWLNILTQRLRTERGQVGGGEGYVPAFYAASDKTDRFTGGTFTTSNALYGLGLRHIRVTAGIVSFTFTGTGCDIIFVFGGSGNTFRWRIDGGAWSATNALNGGAATPGLVGVSPRGLAATSHTIELEHLSGNMWIEGAMVYNGDEDAGIRMIDGAHAGWSASLFGVDPNLSEWTKSINPISVPWMLPNPTVTSRKPPALVTVMLGCNDYATPVEPNRQTAAQFKTNMLALLAKIRAVVDPDPTILLMIPWEMVPTGSPPLSTWAEYRQAYYEIAATDNQVGLLDLGTIIGNFTEGDPYDLEIGDGVHLSDKGYRVVADAVHRMLTMA